ncbi:MAG TPA: hypothetical protein VGC34_11035, partial [Steroidobacteraceae bacterium]
GVLVGMSLFGTLLGYIGMRFNLEQEVTLTRVLVLLVTAQPLCLGFGGTMPVSYLVWMRSMAAVGLMHVLFARVAPAASRPTALAPAAERTGRAPAASLDLPVPLALAAPTPRFPNLMR